MILKDWQTKNKLRAVVYKNDRGHLCGYVAINKNHPLFGKNYSDETGKEIPNDEPIGKRGIIPIMCFVHSDKKSAPIDVYFNVHGGVTYSDRGGTYPVISTNDDWWFGFDCAHADDNPVKCNENYVIEECENFAKQLSDFEKE